MKKPNFRPELNQAIERVEIYGYTPEMAETNTCSAEEIARAIEWFESEEGQEYQQSKYDI